MMRKLNGILVIIIIAMLAIHSILAAFFLGGLIKYSPNYQITGRRLFIVLCVHMLISIYLMLQEHFKHHKIYKYARVIRETRIQAVTGVLIILFMISHVILYSIDSVANPSTENIMIFLHLLTDLLLITSILIHLAVSIPRLCVSLGVIGSQKGYEKGKKIVFRILTVLWVCYVFAEASFYLFY